MANPGKYALIERERRFLVASQPSEAPVAERRISDRYLIGTRIRLRRVEATVDGVTRVERKLTQKVPELGGPRGRQGLITTMYLDEDEYERFASLPAHRLTKTRLSFPPMGLDVFDPPHGGLLIAEVEFADDDAMTRFEPPAWCGREITGEPRYRGADLARLAARGEHLDL